MKNYYLIGWPEHQEGNGRIHAIKAIREVLAWELRGAKELTERVIEAGFVDLALTDEQHENLAKRLRLLPAPLPLAAPQVGRSATVRVRIACAINNRGEWNALGWRTGSETPKDDDIVQSAYAPLEPANLEVLHWIEADVPIPTIASETIEAEVARHAG